MSAPLSDILAPDPSVELLRRKYNVAFAALNAINCDSRTLTDAQLRARLAVQTCIDLGDCGELRDITSLNADEAEAMVTEFNKLAGMDNEISECAAALEDYKAVCLKAYRFEDAAVFSKAIKLLRAKGPRE